MSYPDTVLTSYTGTVHEHGIDCKVPACNHHHPACGSWTRLAMGVIPRDMAMATGHPCAQVACRRLRESAGRMRL